MPFVQHPASLSDFVQLEYDPRYTRDVVTLATGGENYGVGTVLGRITVGGNFTDYDSTASDGTEVAMAVLADNYTDTGSAQQAVVLIRGPVLGSSTGLVFKSGETAGGITAAKAALDVAGIVIRDAG